MQEATGRAYTRCSKFRLNNDVNHTSYSRIEWKNIAQGEDLVSDFRALLRSSHRLPVGGVLSGALVSDRFLSGNYIYRICFQFGLVMYYVAAFGNYFGMKRQGLSPMVDSNRELFGVLTLSAGPS